mgnify:FL=1
MAYYPSAGSTIDNTSNVEYDGTNLKIVSSGQISFYTNSGDILFGNFSSPSYGRAGFSVPGQSVMVVDYSTARAGFGGGTNLITTAPAGLVEIQGKSDEVQLYVKAQSSQSSDIIVVKDNSNNTAVKVINDGTIITNKLVLPLSQPSSAQAGSVYFDTTSSTLYIYDGSTWKSTILT